MAAAPGLTTYPQYHVVQVQWSLVVAADTFAASVIGSRYTDRGVQVEGTFNGATVLVEGSYDGTNYHTLTGTAGPASFAVAGQTALIESPPYMRATHSGGGGSESITVTVRGTDV